MELICGVQWEAGSVKACTIRGSGLCLICGDVREGDESKSSGADLSIELHGVRCSN